MTARAYRLDDGKWVCDVNGLVVCKGGANKADDMAKAINSCITRGCRFVVGRFSLTPMDKKAWHVIPHSSEYGYGDPILSFGNSGNGADDFASDLNAAVARGEMPDVPVPAMGAARLAQTSAPEFIDGGSVRQHEGDAPPEVMDGYSDPIA